MTTVKPLAFPSRPIMQDQNQIAFTKLLAGPAFARAFCFKANMVSRRRALTSLGLGEAKALVDEAPKPVLEGAKKEDAEKAKAQLEAAGATVELK